MERRTLVFKSFLTQLGMNQISYENRPDQAFNVWLMRKLGNRELEQLDVADMTFDKMKEDGMIFLTKLNNHEFMTVNDMTKAASEVTYQKLRNIPVSAYLFSVNDCPYDSFIVKDYNYVAYDYEVDKLNYYNFKAQQDNFSGDAPEEDSYEVQMMKAMGTYEAPVSAQPEESSATSATEYVPYLINEYDVEVGPYYNPPGGDRIVPVLDSHFNPTYWEDNYGFFSAYDSDEYAAYAVPEDYLDESEVQCTWKDIENHALEDGPAVFGAVMITYNDVIPVAYVQLPFNIKAKTCKVSIRWSANGIIKGS